MTLGKFVDEVDVLRNIYPERDLETYLLAIYKNLQDNIKIYSKSRPTLDLILSILKESFTTEPALFDNNWLKIKDCPDANRLNRKFTNLDIREELDKVNRTEVQGLEFTFEVLKFQIAELHKMRGKQLENEYRYFGIDSETGNRWYNFDPFTNLECGVACLVDNEDDIENIDWSFIGNLLEDGRIYE